jgi:hypothetical protein
MRRELADFGTEVAGTDPFPIGSRSIKVSLQPAIQRGDRKSTGDRQRGGHICLLIDHGSNLERAAR